MDLVKDFRSIIRKHLTASDGREEVFVRFGKDTMYSGFMWQEKNPYKYFVYIPKLNKTIEVEVGQDG